MATKFLQAGDLSRRINILQKDQLQDSFGTTGYVETPLFENVPAYRRAKAGNEASQDAVAPRVTAKQREVFDVRYRPQIKPSMVLVYEGRKYNITAAYEGTGRRQWTVIEAEITD